MSSKRPRNPRSKTPQPSLPTGATSPVGGDSKQRTGLDNVGFVVDLFLDESKRVCLTQALHVKSGEGEEWEGWDEKRLISFFVRRAELQPPEMPNETELAVEEESLTTEVSAAITPRILSGETGSVEQETKGSGTSSTVTDPPQSLPEPVAEVVQVPDGMMNKQSSGKDKVRSLVTSTGRVNAGKTSSRDGAAGAVEQIILLGVEIILQDTLMASRLIKSGQPFNIRLSFSLTDFLKLNGDSLEYTTQISARRFGGGSRSILCQSHGVIKATDDIIMVGIPHLDLQPGVYRLEAALEVKPSAIESISSVAHSSAANWVLQVY
jgi:hypothetical protein